MAPHATALADPVLCVVMEYPYPELSFRIQFTASSIAELADQLHAGLAKVTMKEVVDWKHQLQQKMRVRYHWSGGDAVTILNTDRAVRALKRVMEHGVMLVGDEMAS